MTVGRLSELQARVLTLLATIEPAWTLTGGGALAGFHTKHRETRDLDPFFRGERALGSIPDLVRVELERAGLSVAVLRTSSAFLQLQVRDETSVLVVDLVADPTPIAELPGRIELSSTTILVDTPHQLLVNRLCALLSRSELRDLVDVRELLEHGGDLIRALDDCPRQDAGFSPLTFGWSTRGLPVERLATALGWETNAIESLVRFRDELVERVIAAARPTE